MVFRNTKSKINLLCGGRCSKSFSHTQPHLILTKIQRGDYYYYPYFTDDTTKAQRGWVSAQGHTASERRSLGLHAGSLAAESLLSLPRGEGACCERSPGWAFWAKNMISAFLFFINMSVSLHRNPVRIAVANITWHLMCARHRSSWCMYNELIMRTQRLSYPHWKRKLRHWEIKLLAQSYVISKSLRMCALACVLFCLIKLPAWEGGAVMIPFYRWGKWGSDKAVVLVQVHRLPIKG